MSNTLLKVQPSELKIPFELGKQSSCCLQLTNKTNQYVAFKVKTTNPKKYSVRSNVGIILPGGTCSVTVTMQAPREIPADYHCKDKFLIQSVVTADGATIKDIASDMFIKAPGKIVEEFKLRVVYIPANPPSPVPEEGEEDYSLRSSALEDEASSSSFVHGGSRTLEEPSRDEASEASPLISKLTKEKAHAIEQNQKMQRELDSLRKQRGGRPAGFSVIMVVIILLSSIVIGYMFK